MNEINQTDTTLNWKTGVRYAAPPILFVVKK